MGMEGPAGGGSEEPPPRVWGAPQNKEPVTRLTSSARQVSLILGRTPEAPSHAQCVSEVRRKNPFEVRTPYQVRTPCT